MNTDPRDISNWNKVSNFPGYVVWNQPPKTGFNTFSVVVKIEDGTWVSFISAGYAGTTILNQGGTKEENLKHAMGYMKEHPC